VISGNGKEEGQGKGQEEEKEVNRVLAGANGIGNRCRLRLYEDSMDGTDRACFTPYPGVCLPVGGAGRHAGDSRMIVFPAAAPDDAMDGNT